MSDIDRTDATPALRIPSLGLDILSTIMELAVVDSPSVTSTMMRTCKALYREGPRHLLKSHLPLYSPFHLRSYLYFVGAEDGARYHLVKTCFIAVYGDLQYDTAELLIQTFPKLQSLERVRLDHPNTLMKLPRFRDAFAGLTSIKHLALSAKDSLSLDVLPRMQSQLVSLSLGYSTRHEPITLYGLVPQSCGTLRSFHSRFMRLSMSAADPPFTQLEVLQLVVEQPGELEPYTWRHSFPRLRELHFSSNAIGPRDPDSLRSRNLNTRRLDTGFAFLEQLHAPLLNVYHLGLSMHIDALHVHVPHNTSTLETASVEFGLLPVVLTDTTPRAVFLTVTDTQYTVEGLLRSMFEPSSWAGVADLTLVLGFTATSSAMLHRLIRIHVEVLNPVPLKNLTLSIPALWETQSTFLSDDSDPMNFAQRFISTHPTLQSARVTLMLSPDVNVPRSFNRTRDATLTRSQVA